MTQELKDYLFDQFANVFLGEKVPVNICNKEIILIPANKKIVKRDINLMVNNYENLTVEINAFPIKRRFDEIKEKARILLSISETQRDNFKK